MVHHLQDNTNVNRYLKLFILLLSINILLMLLLSFLGPINEILLFGIFALIGINSFSIFYLIIKKI